MDFGIVGVGAITVICYLVAIGIKATKLNKKLVPVICGGCGLALGIVAMFFMPDFPADDIITAAAVGVVSGLAATGVNQIYKQLTKG
jgi:multisubunit Na+/H+ antiporter MnhB subunit